MSATLTPFLTDLDSRAAIKGSRDPLGLVPLWSRFGRNVVGNLTTASGALRGFTTLLLAHYFAERIQDRDGREAESPLDLFLKFEQLAGYVRVHLNGDSDLRGVDRIRATLAQGPKAPLGTDQSRQILGNQKTYGLWGLYSTPAANSGLLVAGEHVLTPEARRFVEQHYLPRLAADGFREGRAFVELLRRKTADVHLEGRDAALARSVAKLLAPKLTSAEREFYDFHLVRGGPHDSTEGRQALLAELLMELPADSYFRVQELKRTIARAAKRKDGAALADRLREILHVEAVLVPLGNAFSFMLTRDRQPLEKVAGEIRSVWGRSLKHVEPEAVLAVWTTIGGVYGSDAAGDRFAAAARALAGGDYEEFLRLLLEHNAFVMQARNGAQPWVRLDGGRISVQYRDETGEIIPGDELPDVWRSTYFINALHGIVRAVRGS